MNNALEELQEIFIKETIKEKQKGPIFIKIKKTDLIKFSIKLLKEVNKYNT